MVATASYSSPLEKKRLKLALQGGGARGAYTAGVLMNLLRDPKIEIVEISGTSAGEKLALIVADAINQSSSYDAGRERAIHALGRFWARLVQESASTMQALKQMDAFYNGTLPGNSPNMPIVAQINAGHRTLLSAFEASAKVMQNSLFTPWMWPANMMQASVRMAFNSAASAQKCAAGDMLRNIIADAVTTDYDRQRNDHIVTHAASGKFIKVHINTAEEQPDGTMLPRIHTGQNLTIKRSMGSSALKGVFEPSIIDGRPHWDGAYVENPNLRALVESSVEADGILVVGVNRPQNPHMTGRLQTEISAHELEETQGLVLHHMYEEVIHRADNWQQGEPTWHVLAFEHPQNWDWTSKQNTQSWNIKGLMQRGDTDAVSTLAHIRPHLGVRSTVRADDLEAMAIGATHPVFAPATMRAPANIPHVNASGHHGKLSMAIA